MYEIFKLLCQKNNVTPYRVSKDTGIPQATLSDWKRGISTPKVDKLQKIANYFNVSIGYLMTGKEKEKDSPAVCCQNAEVDEIVQQLFEKEDLRVLFDAAKDASRDDLKTTYDMLMALKKKEGTKGDV